MLTSSIALQGVYCTKRKYAKKVTDNAYPERQFYLNLLGNDKEYGFKFLSKADARVKNDETYYFLVRKILKQPTDIDSYYILDELKV